MPVKGAACADVAEERETEKETVEETGKETVGETEKENENEKEERVEGKERISEEGAMRPATAGTAPLEPRGRENEESNHPAALLRGPTTESKHSVDDVYSHG